MHLPSTARTFVVPRTESVSYGAGAVDGLDDIRSSLGAARLAVVRPRFLCSSGIDQRIRDILGDSAVAFIDNASQHVPLGHVLRIADELRAVSADCVVSIGGGTAIDAVKAAILCISYGVRGRGDFLRLVERSDLAGMEKAVRHIAIPTTLSGAEHTALAGITIEETREKVVLLIPALAPDAVILDPQVTTDTPGQLWTSSGIRAVDHAVEGMLSGKRMPFMDALARHSLELMVEHLPRSAKDPMDQDARMGCMMATWLSIFALPNVGVGLSHGIGHQLAAEFDLLHGFTSAVMLPHVMEFGAAHTRPQLRAIAEAMGVDTRGLSDEQACHHAVAQVRALVDSVQVPSRLSELGVDRARLDNVATNAMKDKAIAASPRPVSRKDILDLLHAAW